MKPQGRKNFFVPSTSFNSPQPKCKSNKKSNVKSQRSLLSYDSSIQRNHLESNVKKMMTSDPYNRIFNKLMNITELKEFIRQSSQYVEFQQEQVKKFIPPAHNQKFRFSFSLKSANSVCSYLAKDYRFLKRYHELLQVQFPEKKDQLREEIYQTYKNLVLDRKKFDEYFEPKHLNSIKGKRKSFAKFTFKSKQKKKHQYPLKTVQSQKKILLKSTVKPPIQLRTKKLKNIKNQNQSKQQVNQIKQLDDEKLKNQESSSNFSVNSSKKWNPSQKRTTQQNLQLIEETLIQIELLKASSTSLGENINQTDENLNPNPQQKIATLSKKKNLSSKKDHTDSKKSILNKKNSNKKVQKENQNLKSFKGQIEKDESQKIKKKEKTEKTPEPFDEEAMYERIVTRRMSNKPKKMIRETEEQREQRLLGIQPLDSKIKSKKKDEHKTVKFSELIDINDPKHKEFLEKFDRMEALQQKKKEQSKHKNEKMEQFMKRIAVRAVEMKQEVRHSFGQKQKNALTPQEREMVSLFPAISSIGGWKHYTFDRAHSSFVELGECFGYKVEKIGCWPTQDSEVDEVYFCLYLKKIESSNSNNPAQTERNQQEIEKLKEKIRQLVINAITILFIEK